MWQIENRLADRTLWISKDAEGKPIYAMTQNRSGIPTEPSGCQIFYSKKIALNVGQLLNPDELSNNHAD